MLATLLPYFFSCPHSFTLPPIITIFEYEPRQYEIRNLAQFPCGRYSCLTDTTRFRYLNERRLNGNDDQPTPSPLKRPATEQPESPVVTGKRPRGRPKGSKNKAKSAEAA